MLVYDQAGVGGCTAWARPADHLHVDAALGPGPRAFSARGAEVAVYPQIGPFRFGRSRGS